MVAQQIFQVHPKLFVLELKSLDFQYSYLYVIFKIVVFRFCIGLIDSAPINIFVSQFRELSILNCAIKILVKMLYLSIIE